MKFYWKRIDKLCTYVFVCVYAKTQPSVILIPVILKTPNRLDDNLWARLVFTNYFYKCVCVCVCVHVCVSYSFDLMHWYFECNCLRSLSKGTDKYSL